jgi:hypothetical protein
MVTKFPYQKPSDALNGPHDVDLSAPVLALWLVDWLVGAIHYEFILKQFFLFRHFYAIL